MSDQTEPMEIERPIPSLPADEIRSRFIDFFKIKGSTGETLEESEGHTLMPSSPVVPHDDPTLLFTNAGMNQFKPIFLGQADPNSEFGKLQRAVSTQKCIRAGGKHNDLDDVGKDTYHHTFFEMLGNWSFGDYFKKEAIDWAWELLTEVFGVPGNRLYATYFAGDPKLGLEPDNEAKELWLRHLPADHVLPFDAKDNFWEMGDTGPCGPCSEIHYDRIGGRNASGLVNADDENVIEIWNLVFIQYDRQGPTTLKPLPAQHVDTGMGFERMVSVLQNVRSNYDTDLFTPIFAAIERATGAPPYRGRMGKGESGSIDTAYCVVADHIRTLTFAITDGATPSNEGRGYVLRRVLRRAVRYGRQMLGAKTGFLADLVPVVVQRMGETFPELTRDPERVRRIILEEEESFGRTLDRGIKLFEEAAGRAISASLRMGTGKNWIHRGSLRGVGHQGDKQATERRLRHFFTADDDEMEQIVLSELSATAAIAETKDKAKHPFLISGDDAFQLYDTYGFPLDLTQLMAEERGLTVDVAGYEKCMSEQQERSRAGGKTKDEKQLVLDADAIVRLRGMNVPATDDSAKYERKQVRTRVRAIWNGSTFEEKVGALTAGLKPIGVVLDRTPFYAEAGGQVADTGQIELIAEHRTGAETTFRVEHVQQFGEYVLHIGHVHGGDLHVGADSAAKVNAKHRAPTEANHTATHLLNFALREALGDGVDQKGSLVDAERLRFDFSHNKPMTAKEAKRVEDTVHRQIAGDLGVYTGVVSLDDAKKITGVRAVFGENYPDPVRVVAIGQTVEDMLKNPESAAWGEMSIEFCAGTHLESTRHAEVFALVSETGIAKGIRRIEALTGIAAKAAHDTADQIVNRVNAAGKLDPGAMDVEITLISTDVDQMTMPIWRKEELRERLGVLHEHVKAEHKKTAKAARAQASQMAVQVAESAAASMEQVIVTSIDLGGDRDAMQAAVKTIQDRCPKAGVMLFSEHDGRVALIASVPDELIKRGLKAGDWIKDTAPLVGGKGGGRPQQAQGSGSDTANVKGAIKHARTFAHKIIMG